MAASGWWVTDSNTKENKLFKVFKSGEEMNTFLIDGTTLKNMQHK